MLRKGGALSASIGVTRDSPLSRCSLCWRSSARSWGWLDRAFSTTSPNSKVKTAQIQMENLASALDLFYLDAGRYPTTEEGLKALVQRPAGVAYWSGPYLKSTAVPNDPWGHAFLYRAPGQSGPYDVGSLGPEGREGSANAISRRAQAK